MYGQVLHAVATKARSMVTYQCCLSVATALPRPSLREKPRPPILLHLQKQLNSIPCWYIGKHTGVQHVSGFCQGIKR